MKKNLRKIKKQGELYLGRVVQTFILLLMTTMSFSQVTVNSLSELLPYLDDDNVEVTLSPGNYYVTADSISAGKYTDFTEINDNKAYVLFLFEGNNSTFDFTDVTIYVETEVFNAIESDAGDFYEIQVIGNNNQISNLTLIDDGDEDDYPKYGCNNIVMDGSSNIIEGFNVTSTGSYPYGYGDSFGKGATYTIKHYKHSTFLVRGEYNIAKNDTLIHRTYGHCMFMQAASYPTIEGCYIEGEVRSTDDMLAEISGPAYDIDFYTVWGYTLPAGYMMSTGEAGIRAYNAGNTIIDGTEYSRGTSYPTVKDCTIKYMRTGVTLSHATGTRYVEGCTAIGCENGFSLGSGDVVDCYADCAYGPVYQSTYASDNSYNADITIIPAVDEYYNGSKTVAYIGGSDHNITLSNSESSVNQDYIIKFGGTKDVVRLLYESNTSQDDFDASDITINNLTNYPIVLQSNSSDNTGTSGGMVTDLGTNNTIEHTAVSVSYIEAEDYTGMSGVTTETTSDESGTDNVTSIDVDDYLTYEVDVPYSGTYSMDYRVASSVDGNSFILSVDDEALDNVTFDTTGGDQAWSTVTSTSVFYLTEGTQTFEITSSSAGWNFNWMDLALECADSEIGAYAEIYNVIGTTISTETSFDISIFPGNSISFQPDASNGGTWSWSGPNSFTSDSSVVEINDIEAIDAGEYLVSYTNECGQISTATYTISVSDSYYFEAESYSTMSGVETVTTSDASGTSDVTSIDDTDWMEYSIDVPFSATYNIDYRVGSASSGGAFTVSVDGEDIEDVSFSTTLWSTVSSASAVYLEEGTHTFKITSSSAGWYINWIQLNGEDYVSPCSLPFEPDVFDVQNDVVVWSSGLMDITCATTVNAYVAMSEVGTLTSSDYLNVYYKLESGDKIAISQNTGALSETEAIVEELAGSTLELIIEASSSSADNYYSISKINIVETTDQFARIEAEDYDEMSGVTTGSTADVDGDYNLGSVSPDDWSMYENIDLTNVKSFYARVGTVYDDAYIEVRLDSIDGTLISTLDVTYTGAWQTYTTDSAYVEDVTGIYDVYLVYQTDGSSNVCNINWFQFSNTYIKGSIDPYSRVEAENYDEENGTVTSITSDVDGDSELGSIEDGDYVMFNEFDISEASTVDVRVACAIDDCVIEVRTDSVDGSIISYIEIPNTGSASTWQTVSTNVDELSAESDIYFVFRGDGDDIFKFNWLQFVIYENAYDKIEAEDYDEQFGDPTTGETTDDDDGYIVKSIVPGDWIMFEDIDVSGANSISARFGSIYDDAYIEVRRDSSDGTLLSTIELYNTDGWHEWETTSGNLTVDDGSYDLYFVFQTESSVNVCNINYFQLSEITLSESTDVSSRIEVEDYILASGTETITTTDYDGEYELSSIQDGDWIRFDNVDLTGLSQIDIRVASANNDCTIEVRLDSYEGTLLSTIEVQNTGSASVWETVSALFEEVEGEYNIYLVFNGVGDDLLHVNWFQISDYIIPEGYYEAEDYDDMEGVDTETTSDDTGDSDVTNIDNDDWIVFNDVDLSDVSNIDIRYSAPNDECIIEVRLGSTTGTLIANVELDNTGSYDVWNTLNTDILSVDDGNYDVYLVFKGDTDYLLNLNWVLFNDNPFARLEAEENDASSGDFSTEETSDNEDDGEGYILSDLASGYYVMFENVDLTGAQSLSARYATSNNYAYIEARLGSYDGTLIGTIDLSSTGGWSSWGTTSVNITDTVGVYDVYFVYHTESGTTICNSNWFQFSDGEVTETTDALERIEAESYDMQSGTVTTTTTDEDGEEELTTIEDGDWIAFSNIDLTDVASIDVRVASPNSDCTIEVRLDSYDGTLISTITVPNTGAYSVWETATLILDEVDGEYNVYLVFNGTSSDLVNINWLQGSIDDAIELTYAEDIILYPNPVVDNLTITGAVGSCVQLYNCVGKLMLVTEVDSDEYTMDMTGMVTGFYLLRVIDSNGSANSYKVTKK